MPSRPYMILSVVPLALWIAGNIYVSQFEGWGGWAAAPILLVPLAVSFVVGVVGVALFFRTPEAERRSIRSVSVLILPWVPILLVVVRVFWRSLVGQ